MISMIVIVLVAGTLYYLIKTANDFYQKEEELDNIVRKRYVGEGVERKEDKKRVLDDIIPISAGYVLGSLTSHQTNPSNSSSIFKEVTESIMDSFIGDSGSSAGGGSTSSWSDSSSDSGSDSGGSSGD